MTTLTEFFTEFEVAKAKFVAEAEAKLHEAFKAFFNENPGIKKISWRQYTPYFNDGEQCVFWLIEPTFSNDADFDEEEDDEQPTGFWQWGDDAYGSYEGAPTKEEVEAMKALSAIWGFTVADEIFKDVFGDHAQIVVTAAGIDVQEYDHD